MREPWHVVLAVGAGIVIGAMYFAGLWWTVRKTMTATTPGLWVVASLFVRLAIALAGFFYVSDGHWQRWVACLVGFIAARPAVTALTRPRTSPEVGHAP